MMRTVKVSDGTEIAYYVDDFMDGWIRPEEKETIVLYHGTCGNASAFIPMAATLARRYRVVRIDERGMGESKMAPGTYKASTERFVADLLAVVDDLGLDKFYLFAESSGSLIAIPFVLDNPHRVKSLILLQAPYRMPPGLEPKYKLGESSIGAAIRKHGFREWQRLVPGYRVFNLEKVDPRIVEWFADFRALAPTDVAAGRTEWAFTVDLSQRIKDISVPTFLINAGGSLQTGLDVVNLYRQQNPRIEVMTLDEDLGQNIHIPIPDRVSAMVLDYLGARNP